MHIFISSCSSWVWLSGSYSFIFQIAVYKKIWKLASDTDIVVSFENDIKKWQKWAYGTDGNSHIFLQRMILKTYEYDSESHIQELHADIKIYIWSLFRKVAFVPLFTTFSFFVQFDLVNDIFYSCIQRSNSTLNNEGKIKLLKLKLFKAFIFF